MTVVIRPALLSDTARCIELLAALNSATKSAPLPESAQQKIETAFGTLLSNERGRIIVAEEDGVCLGMATVSYNLAMRYGGEYCQLEELIVDPAGRGKNIGGLLVKQTVADARRRGCAEYGLYLLKSTEHNKPFYEKYGFVLMGSEMRQRL
jgi:GNAT superfamily N-acetyltransferase